jgi:hypothetical protein
MSHSPPDLRTVPQFAAHSLEVAQRLRRAISSALSSVGADLERPQNTARKLGLDKSLAWKVVRLVSEDNDMGALVRVPGRAGQKILVDALVRAAAPAPIVAELQGALDEYERLIEVHAGDRDTFEIMLTQLSRESRMNAEESHRRQAFQGNCAIFGVQARAQVTCHIVAPIKGSDDKVTVGVVGGLVEVRRLRENTSWAVATAKVLMDDGKPMSWLFAPLDPSVTGPEDPPLLKRYCSGSEANLRQVRTADGVARLELVGGPVGRGGAVTCFVGYYHRTGLNRFADENNFLGQHFTTLSTPTEWLILDFLAHRSLNFAMFPELAIHSKLPSAAIYPGEGSESSAMPLADEPERIENPGRSECAEFPQARELMAFATERIGYSLDDFVLLRLRLRYPPVPTVLIFRYPLPTRD